MKLRRGVEIDLAEQLKQMQLAAIDASNIIDMQREKEIAYKKIIAELTPSWFDKYKLWIGVAIGWIAKTLILK